jgi:hypothetical protein
MIVQVTQVNVKTIYKKTNEFEGQNKKFDPKDIQVFLMFM